jgi:superfamily I DNA/RNA helicase
MTDTEITFATNDVTVYLAAAGSGKTTAIMKKMTELLEIYRPDEIAFVTFTRKGVANGIERALQANPQLTADDLTHFKTLHALCFRELGLKHSSIIERKDMNHFNELLGFNVHLSDAFDKQTDDDKLLSRYDAIRSGSKKGIYIHGTYDEERYERLIRAYEKYKKENSLVDFYDCLLRFREAGKPVAVKVAFIDEAQDLTPLQWEVCQIAFSQCEKICIAGDDYQCQPAGSPVLTQRGHVGIEYLKPSDKLIVWDRPGQAFYGFQRRSYAYKRSRHYFSGDLIVIDYGGLATAFTPNHRMIVRWLNRDTSLYCVYLMRRDNNYRIGQCQIFNKNRTTHLAFRMRQEQADALWVIKVSRDRKEIRVAEQVIAAKYGLPQICFTWHEDFADEVFKSIDTAYGAIKCLKDFHLEPMYPLLNDSRIRTQSGGTSIFETEACNIIPEVMAVPVYREDARKTYWQQFTMYRRSYRGYVYGLDVEKYHTYVTNGIVTHNSLFTYAGASPRTLVSLAQRYTAIKLEKSYRLSQAVYDFAKGITHLIEDKIDKDFKPAKDVKGFVKEMADRQALVYEIKRDIEKNGIEPYRWYLLFRNNCFIARVADILEQFIVPYHTHIGFCLDERDLAKIKRYYNYRIKGYGTKEAFNHFCNEHNIKDINNDFIESDLIPGERRYVFASYVNKYGIDALIEMSHREPFLLLSTTHKVKGGEADYAAVFLDCTRRVSENVLLNTDEELRVLYVACTRARIGLYLVDSENSYGLGKVVDVVKEVVA